jgi:hypothetical protein
MVPPPVASEAARASTPTLASWAINARLFDYRTIMATKDSQVKGDYRKVGRLSTKKALLLPREP